MRSLIWTDRDNEHSRRHENAGRPGQWPRRRDNGDASVERQTRLIRNLIWLYIVLWLIEGALRRWFLPGLASPLLLIRDPVVIAIYCIAVSSGLFPVNGFVIWGALLALLSFVNAMVMGHGNILVALYGVRCDFIHVPLIFVMGKVLREKDLIAMAKVAVWVAVPYTALLVAQFYQPQDAWVNRGSEAPRGKPVSAGRWVIFVRPGLLVSSPARLSYTRCSPRAGLHCCWRASFRYGR